MLENLKCGGKNKFIVLKRDDCNKYLDKEHGSMLSEVLQCIAAGRLQDQDKTSISNEYLVINTDEPYAPEIIEIMKRNGHWG